jgi:hypothetical protein
MKKLQERRDAVQRLEEERRQRLQKAAQERDLKYRQFY